jgi:hypothetical protein
MSYRVKSYKDLSVIETQQFIEFCKLASTEKKDPASVNMWDENENSKHTILYKLDKTPTFTEPNGIFFILFYNDQIVGCSGVYKSSFSNEIYIAGARTWIDKRFRNQSVIKEYFFPMQKKWVIDKAGKIIALTFNEYNKNIIEIFKRNRLGEKNNRINKRSEGDLFFNGINVLDFPVNINYTKQWICYEQLESNFVFDWEIIKFI